MTVTSVMENVLGMLASQEAYLIPAIPVVYVSGGAGGCGEGAGVAVAV